MWSFPGTDPEEWRGGWGGGDSSSNQNTGQPAPAPKPCRLHHSNKIKKRGPLLKIPVTPVFGFLAVWGWNYKLEGHGSLRISPIIHIAHKKRQFNRTVSGYRGFYFRKKIFPSWTGQTLKCNEARLTAFLSTGDKIILLTVLPHSRFKP